MDAYHHLLRDIMINGERTTDRTGTGTRAIFGAQMQFDLSKGFPLVTTKKVHLKSVIHELLWFLRGDTNIKYLNDNDVHIWDAWADADGNLGQIYGSQWRNWQDYDSIKEWYSIDQIANLIKLIDTNPNSRRMIVSAWNVADIDEMALPPCHMLFQVRILGGKLHLRFDQRSADMFLGVPFNIASYALLTMMLAQVTGYKPGTLTHHIGDAHIYENHINQVCEQLRRKQRPLPDMRLNASVESIFDFKYEDFEILNYNPHPAISAPVAV